MGCCSNRPTYQHFDQFTAAEETLGLSEIPIEVFQSILRHIQCQNNRISLFSLGETFFNYEFGIKIQQGNSMILNRVLGHQLFQHYGGIDRNHIFNLGLLYTNGSLIQKVICIYKFYDTSENEVLLRQNLSTMISDLIYIANVIFPAALQGINSEELEKRSKGRMNALRERAEKQLLQIEGKNEKQRQKNILENELNYLFHSSMLRQQLKKETQSE